MKTIGFTAGGRIRYGYVVVDYYFYRLYRAWGTGFFIWNCLALGRFLSGVFAKKLTCWNIIHIGFGVLGVAVACIWLPVSYIGISCAGLFLAGLGNGPMYPNLTYLTPIHFGEEICQSVIGSQMAFSYVGIMVMPTVFGFLAQILSTDVFSYYVGVLFVAFLTSMFLLKRALKKEYGIQVR